MVKKGFDIDEVPILVSPAGDKIGWALCIGAGTSIPIFPSWDDLAEKLSDDLVPDYPLNVSLLRRMGYSADALIQSVKNYSNLDDNEFAKKMSRALYANFMSKIDKKDQNAIERVFESTFSDKCALSNWKIFSKYRDALLKGTTSYALANVINKTIEQGIPPKAILSFNAEPLLLVILNSILIDNNSLNYHQCPKKIFAKVINSLSSIGPQHIPYIFCHGLLPVKDSTHSFSTSVDKLVFLEEEYIQLSNSAFSWQAATFLNICLSQHIIFIGTSLTDANMRRWLSWVNSNRLNELRQNGVNTNVSTQHYWIRTTPHDKTAVPWIEATVSHLGIRIIWIDSWDKVDTALEKILGIS